MPLPIPTTVTEISPDWLTTALRGSSATTSRVTTATFARIGEDEGFTGGCLYRLTLTYDPPDTAAPKTLVAKLSPDNPETRTLMRAANAREVAFYQSQLPGNHLPVPRCYHADFDPETGASILLLQDLNGYRSVPFIKGCGPADAKRVIEALATLHAKWWNAPDLANLSGVSMLREYPFDQVWPQYFDKARALLQGIEMPDALLKLGDFIAKNEAQIFANLMETAPMTCLHRDLQVDNVMFAKTQGRGAAILFDWQFAGKGRGAYDVGYFLISSVNPAQRRQMERGLVAHYHAKLLRLGVTGYSLAQCWADYLQSVAGKMFITVAATVLLDNSSPHKQAWRRADLTRLLAFCADHGISEQTFRL
jgi:aminoglycoside/choline kinase family phosphotransferase